MSVQEIVDEFINLKKQKFYLISPVVNNRRVSLKKRLLILLKKDL